VNTLRRYDTATSAYVPVPSVRLAVASDALLPDLGGLRNDPAAAAPFRVAAGECEVQTDAGKVNTTTGWRDLKSFVCVKRPRGPATEPSDWDDRTLPAPTARVLFSDIEEIETFRRDWRDWADRPGIGSGPALTVLGDGAEWIWNAAGVQFPQCRQVWDVFHALEHVAAAARGLYGEATEAMTASYEVGKQQLLADGWLGICRYVGDELRREDTPTRRAVLDELIGYLKNHVGRIDYRSRLAEGRTIGSGLIEGQVKTLGLRLKARGARWRERTAEQMAALIGLSHSTLWDTYWALAA
jgi:hypothetical protein